MLPAENWFWIRGLVRESGHWGDLPAKFEKTLLGSRVHCLDLPGNGRYWKVPSPPRMASLGRFLEEEAKKVLSSSGEANAPSFLVAISMGGMAAMEWIAQNPGRFAGAVLINTSFRGLNPVYHRLRPTTFPKILRIALVRDRGEREKRILNLTSHRPDRLAVTSRWTEIQREHPVSVRNAFRQLLAAGRYHAPKNVKPPPLLILQSEKDGLLNAACGSAIQKAWGGKLELHPWAGHDLPLDDPEWVLEKIKIWHAELTEGRTAQ